MSRQRFPPPQAGVAASNTELRRQRSAALRRGLTRLGTRLALVFGAGAGAAYGLSLATGVRWTWWIVPLGLVVEVLRAIAARRIGTAPPTSPSGMRIFRDAGPPIYLVSALVGTSVAFWGALNQSSIAITLGAGFVFLGQAFDRSDEPA